MKCQQTSWFDSQGGMLKTNVFFTIVIVWPHAFQGKMDFLVLAMQDGKVTDGTAKMSTSVMKETMCVARMPIVMTRLEVTIALAAQGLFRWILLMKPAIVTSRAKFNAWT